MFYLWKLGNLRKLEHIMLTVAHVCTDLIEKRPHTWIAQMAFAGIKNIRNGRRVRIQRNERWEIIQFSFNYLFFSVADDFIEFVRGNQDKNISNGLRAPLDKRQQSCTFVSLRVFFRSSSDDS
ncbi:unnamed protein product, partial [Nesidiocoris tenuis]